MVTNRVSSKEETLRHQEIHLIPLYWVEEAVCFVSSSVLSEGLQSSAEDHLLREDH